MVDILELRRALHGLMDPLWQKCNLSRTELYDTLSKFLGREAHVSEMDAEEVKDCIRYILDTYFIKCPCEKCRHKIAYRYGIPVCRLRKERSIDGCASFATAEAVLQDNKR